MLRFPAWRRSLAAVAAVALLGVTGAAQAPRPAAARSFVWKVQRGTGAVYIAGSVHALTPDIYPLPSAFQRAFDESGTLVEEIDLGDASMLSSSLLLLGKGMFQDGRTFDQVVSKETAALVAERLKDIIPPELLKPMKPWMVDLTLELTGAQKEGLDPNLGLDKYFFDKASAAGKLVVGLETAESQIDRLDRMPIAQQEQMLRSTIKDLDTEKNGLKEIVSLWRRGDAATLEKTLLASFKDYPAAYTSLVVERNRNWLPQIEACFTRPKGCFVVVGAAHVVGPDGLLAMLQKKGYRIEQQ